MPAAPPRLPARFFRKETVYRSMRGSSREGLLGCGFLLKPGREGWHLDHAREEYSGVLVLRGAGRYADERGHEQVLEPGCFFQRLPGRRHTTTHRPDGTWAECFVAFGRTFCDALAALGSLDPGRPVLRPGLSRALVERFDELVRELAAAPQSELPAMLARVHGLVVDVHNLDRRGERPDAHARTVGEACRLLARDLPARISLPAFAERLGMGYERFRKVFRERVGAAPGDYRIRRRVERARSMLAAGDTSVKKVAYALGYPNAFAFSRQFRKVTGAPPSRFLRAP